jgi:ElaB/YqjD/DUF883 family membrane-anchored ribosome-binding protein
MGKNSDVIEQEIRARREAISGRFDEMRERAGDDADEVASRVKEAFESAGLKEQVEKRPLMVMAGAVGLGVVLGMASESINVRSVLDRDKSQQGRSLNGTQARSGRGEGGLISGLTSALEYAAVDEGRELLRDWIRGLRPQSDERPDGRTRAGSPESPLTR